MHLQLGAYRSALRQDSCSASFDAHRLLDLYIAWNTTSQEAAVVLNAYPTASSDDLTHVGFGVRVQLVNESLRPVIVEKASLWVDGRRSRPRRAIWLTRSSSTNLPSRRRRLRTRVSTSRSA